jgi:hypothetical protein
LLASAPTGRRGGAGAFSRWDFCAAHDVVTNAKVIALKTEIVCNFLNAIKLALRPRGDSGYSGATNA